VAIDVALNAKQDLTIRISDSGIGMTAEERSRVFEEYTQANAATAQRFGGTGLGLAISRKLIQAMGGGLDMTSTIGEGTCFTITLPGPFQASNINGPKPLANRHYALAMHDSVTTAHLALSLEELGATVKLIGDEAELQKRLRISTPLSSVICDSRYGAALQRWAKRKHKSGFGSVWVMLKSEERRALKSLLEPPFSGYLLKPLRRASLLQLLSTQDGAVLKQTGAALRQVQKPAELTRGLQILLAEDNPVNMLLARTMLERCGHYVHCVSNGEAALALLKTGAKFDAALLDVEMPKLDGLETAFAIRSHNILAAGAGKRPLPLLALTANARREDAAACLAAGMDGHLAKPFEQLDLESALRKLLKRRLAA
jgi:CheY-like chemotaxis protein